MAEQKAESVETAIERVLVAGDLARLTDVQRVAYYNQVCLSLGLNPLTKPFDYIVLNGKLTLYARRDATEQLRKIHNVSITSLNTDRMDDLYVVRVTASLPNGRTDASTGAVSLKGLTGEALANATMKAETKAKRRVTLSICGLGMLDESEADSITFTPSPVPLVGPIPSSSDSPRQTPNVAHTPQIVAPKTVNVAHMPHMDPTLADNMAEPPNVPPAGNAVSVKMKDPTKGPDKNGKPQWVLYPVSFEPKVRATNGKLVGSATTFSDSLATKLMDIESSGRKAIVTVEPSEKKEGMYNVVAVEASAV